MRFKKELPRVIFITNLQFECVFLIVTVQHSMTWLSKSKVLTFSTSF